jgi:hypothetical protein
MIRPDAAKRPWLLGSIVLAPILMYVRRGISLNFP